MYFGFFFYVVRFWKEVAYTFLLIHEHIVAKLYNAGYHEGHGVVKKP
jgi:hypothetical protein